MKIRTAIAAPLVASLLLVGAPGHAADPETPPECDEAVQEWRDRSNFWEAKFFEADYNLSLILRDLREERTVSRDLRGVVTSLNASLVEANDEADEWQGRAERRRERIVRLRAKIRALRDKR